MRRFSLDKVVMVGDGATDMEAKPPARLTVGFGGNVGRENVKALADLYIYDFQILISMLKSSRSQTKVRRDSAGSPSFRLKTPDAKVLATDKFKSLLADPNADLI